MAPTLLSAKRVAQWRIQGRYDYRQSAELRSAWTAEGGCPHVSGLDGRGARPRTGLLLTGE